MTTTDIDTAGQLAPVTEHPSESPAYVAAHKRAFSTLPEPTSFRVGQRVWIADHYYPGRVRHTAAASGWVTVETPEWDYESEAPMLDASGALVLGTLHYGPRDRRHLRIDEDGSTAPFWPTAPRAATSLDCAPVFS